MALTYGLNEKLLNALSRRFGGDCDSCDGDGDNDDDKDGTDLGEALESIPMKKTKKKRR